MSLIITDNTLGIEVKNAVVKIAYYTVNRIGHANDGTPRFSANLYLEYRNSEAVYLRKDVSIGNLKLEDLNFETFYTQMKDLPEFKDSEDLIPVYVPIEVPVEEVPEETPEETPAEEASE